MKTTFFSPMWHFIVCAMICTLPSCSKSIQQIIEDAEEATFIVYTYDEYGSPAGSGSGFFIKPEGVGVTNWHVLDKSVKAIIKTSDGVQYEIDSVLSASSKKDILVFRVKNKQNTIFKTLSFAKTKPVKGDKVYNIGAPMGLESSVSEGIVASFREDSHGEIVQTTAAISPGSSGSPLMNENGQVFAIATFKRRGGENVNFGVMMNEDFQKELDSKEFTKKNRKFNTSKSDFILLNLLPEKGSDIVLNAIEFGPTATTLYMTFTNMYLTSSLEWYIWAEVGKKDKGFFIEDKDTKQRYYITSSTLETSKEKAKPIGLAEVLQFKVHFPVIKTHPTHIDVMWGEGDRSSHFTNINLDDYRSSLNVDEFGYQREYALKCTTEGGDFVTTMSILTDLLDENPSDVISLNMMAILSYLIKNNTDAMYYLEEAIDQNPNDELAYFNRSTIYEFSENYKEAIEDITAAINLSPEQPDYYYSRAVDYYRLEDYKNALDDMNKCLEVADKEDGFEDSPYFYEIRAYVYYYLNNKKAARADVQKAYKLSTDKDLDERLQNFYNIL